MDIDPSRTALTGEQTSNTLPIPLTSFIGRSDELELALSLLRDPGRRLLTLTGPGGIGKTRLALEIAHRLAPEFPNGVTFVSLAEVARAFMVMSAIGSALGLRELERDTAPRAVAAALGRSTRLLVIDNIEHVLDAAPELTRLLSQCPHIKMLATSRSLLRVEGEQAIPVPPLMVPAPTTALTQNDWLRVPAIRLFVERARAVDPGYAWSAADMAQLAEICSRLDGLPLALELAATRVRHLTLTEIRDRLDERLPLLIDGSRDQPSRLQTMRNAIAWSHDLLSPAAQVLFRRLAVFQGGFSLDAAESVAAQLDAPDSATDPIRDRLTPLLDASLLLREIDPMSGGARYRMLETIREYAGEQLARSNETDLAGHAHAAYFTHFAEQFEFADLMPASANAVERLFVERANLAVALTWLDHASDTEHFLRLIAAHGNFWSSTANYREAAHWCGRALGRSESIPSPHRAKIQVQLGMTSLLQGDHSGAEPAFTEGLAACRALGEPYYAALAQIGLANIAILQGDRERGAELLRACRKIAGDIPDRRLAELMRGLVSLNLAVISRASGNLDLATEQISDMLRRARAEDYLLGALISLGDLGDLARDRADWAKALSFYKDALTLGRNQPIRRVLIEVIESVAIVAFQTGQLEQCATLLGAAEALRERTGLGYFQPESRTSLSAAVEGTRAALGDVGLATAWQVGRTWSASGAITAAMDVQDRPLSAAPGGLTLRETEIARLLVLGMTDPQIADTLFISVRTVENHVAHILSKLGVHTRTAAASAAIAAGLVTTETR